MAKDGIDLKVYLQPQLEDLNKVQKELGDAVKNIGDEKITKQFDTITQKIAGVSKVFEKDIDLTTFKNVGKEIQNIFNEIQKLTSSTGDLDAAKGFNELEQKILSTGKEIAVLEQQLKKVKEGGKIDKGTKNFSYFATTLDERVAKQGFVREEGIKGAGTPGSQIKSYKTLLNYKEKAEEQGKTETKQYKEIVKLIEQIKKEEAQVTVEYKEKLQILEKQKNILKETQNQAKKIAETPLISEKQNDVDEKTIKNQQKLNSIYASALISKSKTTEAVREGKEAVEEANETTQETSKDVEILTKKQDKQNGVIGKAVKNFTSYTLILGTMKRALRSAIQTIKVLDKSLTEQAMVAGRSRKELQGLLKDYQNIAKATGATTKEVAEVATQYFRQGKSAKEAMILTEAAVSAAKVGAISTAESVDYLTTAINGFGMAAEDATRVSDRFSALAASSATSYEELAVALSKVAAQAHLAEMSMDFTLGLLAKGIETTREAPETIGTALKTVIARMREMTDYGKTLEDGVSVNNLEEQLKYVGIQLRDNNGELRSSEVVLDEVGRSWDSFSKNQQAALAKAFAGTRQQSRFIAMMQDYDRTLELVNISQESSGATMAQMSTYMQGMEAALNNISVGWETLITTFVKSDFVVEVLSKIGDFLNEIGDFFTDQEEGQERVKNTIIAAITLLGLFSANMIGFRLQERSIAKEQLRLAQEQRMAELEKQKDALLLGAIERKNATIKQAEAKQEEAILAFKEAQVLAEQGNTAAAEAKKQEAIGLQEESWKIRETAEDTYQIELNQINASAEMRDINKQISEEKLKQNRLQQSLMGFVGLYNVAVQIGTGLQTGLLKILKKQTKEMKIQAAIQKASNPLKAVAGVAVAAVVGGVGYGIYKGIKKAKQNTPEYQQKQRQKQIKEDNAEIYKLTQQKTKIEAATSAYERYNNSVLKTKEQQAEINKQLDAAADVLTDEQKAEYALLKTEKDRAQYLSDIQIAKEKELNDKRADQRKRIEEMTDLVGEMDKNVETKHTVQDLISHDIQLDGVSKENEAKIKNIIDSQIANMDTTQLAKLYKSENYSAFTSAAKILDQTVEGTTDTVLDIFNAGTLQEQAKVYNEIFKNASIETRKIIDTEFGNIAQIAQNFDPETIDIFGKKGFDLEEIQKQFARLQKLMGEDFTLKNFAKLMKSEDKLKFLTDLKEDVDTVAAGGILQDLIYGPKGSPEKTAQDLTSFKKKIQNIYETQSKWSTMTAEEQRKFKEDHIGFFSDEDAYEKFVSGQDLSANMAKYMDKEREEILREIEDEIAVQNIIINTSTDKKAVDKAKNDLKDLNKQLEELKSNDVFEETLENRLKKEQDAVKVFKDILKEEKQTLIDSLNEQKKAYEDYYAAINKAAEDQDYEEKRAQIAANISKLATGTDASSLAMRADLEQQLKTVEKDRIEQLRQRSQEAVMENIDQQIENAQKELQDIEDNSAGILKLMQDEKNNKVGEILYTGVRNIMSNKNATALEKQKALEDMLAQVSPFLLQQGHKIGDFKISEDGKNLIFNVNGENKTINLSQDDQNSLWEIVNSIMNSLGIQ